MSCLTILQRLGSPLWDEVGRHSDMLADGTPLCACIAAEALRVMKAEGLLNDRGLALLAPFEHVHIA